MRCRLEVIGESRHFGENGEEVLHPGNEQGGRLVVQGFLPDHLQQDILGDVAEVGLVVAAVDREQPGHVGQLVFRRPLDQLVGKAGVGDEVFDVGHGRKSPRSWSMVTHGLRVDRRVGGRVRRSDSREAVAVAATSETGAARWRAMKPVPLGASVPGQPYRRTRKITDAAREGHALSPARRASGVA